MELFWKAAFVFLVFGSVDFFRQMRRHKQDLRMSKQDIKDEMKEVEGNPQMKQRICAVKSTPLACVSFSTRRSRNPKATSRHTTPR